MKLHVLFVAAVVLGLAQLAQADAANLEPVLVTHAVQKGNLMPPVAPGTTVNTTFTVTVISNGCTKQADFKLKVQQGESGHWVTVVRTQPDPCDGVPHPVSLKLSTTKIPNRAPVHLANPLLVDDKVSH